MISCLLCGRCCHYMHKGKIKKCKHLIRINNKRLCRIYNARLGSFLDKDGKDIVTCLERKESKFDYKDCPYNTNKEILEVGY